MIVTKATSARYQSPNSIFYCQKCKICPCTKFILYTLDHVLIASSQNHDKVQRVEVKGPGYFRTQDGRHLTRCVLFTKYHDEVELVWRNNLKSEFRPKQKTNKQTEKKQRCLASGKTGIYFWIFTQKMWLMTKSIVCRLI